MQPGSQRQASATTALLEELVQLRHDQISGSEIVAYPRLYKTGYLSNWLAASCPGKDYEDWPAKDIANFLDPPPSPFNGPEVDQRTARNLRGGRVHQMRVGSKQLEQACAR